MPRRHRARFQWPRQPAVLDDRVAAAQSLGRFVEAEIDEACAPGEAVGAGLEPQAGADLVPVDARAAVGRRPYFHHARRFPAPGPAQRFAQQAGPGFDGDRHGPRAEQQLPGHAAEFAIGLQRNALGADVTGLGELDHLRHLRAEVRVVLGQPLLAALGQHFIEPDLQRHHDGAVAFAGPDDSFREIARQLSCGFVAKGPPISTGRRRLSRRRGGTGRQRSPAPLRSGTPSTRGVRRALRLTID
jgi:hypothetical protein